MPALSQDPLEMKEVGDSLATRSYRDVGVVRPVDESLEKWYKNEMVGRCQGQGLTKCWAEQL